MTPEQMEIRIERLILEMTNLTTEVKELRLAIRGDPFVDKTGVLENQKKMMEIIFDDGVGLVHKVTTLERKDMERSGWIRGVNFMWMLLGGLISALIVLLITKK